MGASISKSFWMPRCPRRINSWWLTSTVAPMADDVASGGERVPGSPPDDGPDVRALRQLGQDFEKAKVHLVVEGVALFGVVVGDDGDRSVVVEQHLLARRSAGGHDPPPADRVGPGPCGPAGQATLPESTGSRQTAASPVGRSMARLHHVNLGIPVGGTDAEAGFLVDLLGYKRVEPPPELASVAKWFEYEDGTQIHLSEDPEHRPAARAHVAGRTGRRAGRPRARLRRGRLRLLPARESGHAYRVLRGSGGQPLGVARSVASLM